VVSSYQVGAAHLVVGCRRMCGFCGRGGAACLGSHVGPLGVRSLGWRQVRYLRQGFPVFVRIMARYTWGKDVLGRLRILRLLLQHFVC
jgi:hypothetical protein